MKWNIEDEISWENTKNMTHDINDTVDGRNPAPPAIFKTMSIMG